jgi:hypothetical protein
MAQTRLRVDRAWAEQTVELLGVRGGRPLAVRGETRAIAEVVAGNIVTVAPPGVFTHVVVNVLPLGVVVPGQFAIMSNDGPEQDTFLPWVQHTDLDSVHVFILNLTHADIFDVPVTFAIFDPED